MIADPTINHRYRDASACPSHRIWSSFASPGAMVIFKKFVGDILVMPGSRMCYSNQQNSRQQKPKHWHPKTFALPPLVEDNFVCLTLSHENRSSLGVFAGNKV